MFHRTTTTISVPGIILPYVRSGLLAEIGSALDVLDLTLALDEVDVDKWKAGVAQFDDARELLDRIGVTVSSYDSNFLLELTPRLGRMLLDALRAVYDAEVQRLANAANDRVQLPLRAIPKLRSFIVDTERRLGRAARNLAPHLAASEKRPPRRAKIVHPES
jgi:hypothetical protein